MATVYVARARGAEGFSRLVALKRAHPHVRDDPEQRAALRTEARLVAQLHHPNIVAVLDVDDTSGELELILDYVEGCTLSEIFRAVEIAAAPRAVLRIVLDVAAGLQAAHRATGDDGQPLGIVHRDISPSNVLVGLDGISRLTDFGVARANAPSAERTATGVLKGKLGYMAPEYVEHYRVDARSDQFSLAVVAWELLARRRLFKGATELETLKNVARGVVPKVSTFEPTLAALDDVLARALAQYPEDRHATVGEFARCLEETGRTLALVGSHSEVAELVERGSGEELRARRQALHGPNGPPNSSAGPRREVPSPASSRDDVATASIVREIVMPRAPASSSVAPATSPLLAPKRAGWQGAAAGSLGIGAVVLAVVALVGRTHEAVDSPRSDEDARVVAPEVPLTAMTATTEAAEPPPAMVPIANDAGLRGPMRVRPPPPPPPIPTKAPPNPYAPKKPVQ